MTEVERLMKKEEKLREVIEQEVGSSTYDLINELVNLNIEIETYCNE